MRNSGGDKRGVVDGVFRAQGRAPPRTGLRALANTGRMFIPGMGKTAAGSRSWNSGRTCPALRPRRASIPGWACVSKNKISGGNVLSCKTGPDVNRAAQAPRRATGTPQKRKSGTGHEFRRLSA